MPVVELLDVKLLLAQTKFDPDLKLDVGFNIHEMFWYGSERIGATSGFQSKSVPIDPPAIEMLSGYVLSQQLTGNEDKLIEYYRSLPEYAKKYDKKYDGSADFWIHPVLYSHGQMRVSFPWVDDLDETLPILRLLSGDEIGWIYNDSDEGWELGIYADAECFHFIETTAEDRHITALVNAERKSIAAMAEAAMDRVQSQIEIMSTAMGSNYWTKQPR